MIGLPRHHHYQQQLNCFISIAANCTVIDSSWFGGNGIGLILTGSGVYSLLYHTGNGR